MTGLILKKLSIKSFGKLKNLDVDLAPGLNIVYGENESGKSTIQSFIKGIFYGLEKKSKKDEISEYEKYEPWDSNEFAGMIVYEADGKGYNAARNFSTNKVSLYNEFWDDVTDEFETDKKRGSVFAEKHIGMNEETFEKTIFIKQLESRINESKDITDRLLNIQQTGLEETSFRNTIEILEGIIKDKIGSDKTSKKPINLISNEIERLLKEKYEVNLLRKEVSELEEKIKQKEHEREKILEKVEQLKNAKQSIKKDSLLELYNKAKEYENSLEITENEIARLQNYENFPDHHEDKLKEVLSDIRNLHQIIKGKREYLEGIESKIQSSEEQQGYGGDSELIYTILSDFQAMKASVIEKDEYQKNLNILNEELDSLNKRAKEFANIDTLDGEDETKIIEYEKSVVELENKLKEIGRIKEEVEKLDNYIKTAGVKLTININSVGAEKGDFSLEDMEQVLSKYRRLSEYKQKVSSTQHEIDKIKNDIAVNDTTLFDLNRFANLPEDIEEQVMKLYDKSINTPSDTKYEINVLSTKEKVFRYKLIANVLLAVISFGLIGFGIYGILFWRVIDSIVSGGIGLLILIFSMIKSVGSLRSIRKINKEKSEKIKYTSQEKDNTNDIEKLNEIYKSAGMQDFTSFMKNLYTYNDVVHKAKLLNLDLGHKTQYLESIKNQLINIQIEISSVLSAFGVMHDMSAVNDTDILNLKEKFNKLVSTGNLNDDNDYLSSIDNKRGELLAQIKRVTGDDNTQLEHAADLHEKIKLQFDDIRFKLSETYERLNINDGAQLFNRVKDGYEIKKEVDLKKYEIVQLQDMIYKLNNKVASIDKKIKFALTENAIEFHEEFLVDEVHIESLKEKLNTALKTTNEISNLKLLKESISYDVTKTEEELNRAFNEKNTILDEAMVTSEEEFFEGCKNRVRIKELLDEKSRILNIQDELLKGESSQSFLQKIASIENTDIYAGQIESLEDAEVQIEDLKNKLDRLNEDIINLKNNASNKLIGRPELNEIVEQLEYLQGRKLELEKSKRSLKVAIEVLNETAKNMQQDFTPRLQNEVSLIIKQITAGKYSEVKANGRLNLNTLDPVAGKIVNIEKLSMGTIEQFYLALRIALSNVLGDGSEKLPIIIDEAFVQYDDIRMLNVLEFLLEVSKFRQIIIFTCQIREVEAIKRIGTDDVKIIELSNT